MLRWAFDWVFSWFGTVGREATIVILGLDNAGKTTLLHKLKHNSVSSFVPTQRARSEEFVHGDITFKAWDLGGHQQVRFLWRNFFQEADGVIFIVDSIEHERHGESGVELGGIVENLPAGIPLLILLNKIDSAEALGAAEVQAGLNLNGAELHGKRGETAQFFRCSVLTGTGLDIALHWFTQNIA